MNVNRRSFGIVPRAVSAADFPAVRDLYARVWERTRDEAYDRMRFLETMDGLPVAATAWSGEDLAGFFTVWPLELTDGRNVVQGGEAMDVMTDNRFRGKGVFPTLADMTMKMAAERGLKLLFGAPNTAIYQTYLKRLAWASPAFLRTYVRPLSLTGAAPFGGLAAPAFALWPRGAGGGTTIAHERPSAEALVACLAADKPKRGKWRVHRTPAWYEFRYRAAGKFDYRWVTVLRDGAPVAFAIWGLALDGGTRLRRANLAEVIGADRAARQAATAAAVSGAARAGANFLAVTMTCEMRAREFRANGFLPYSKSPLIAKTLGPDAFDANPFMTDGWDLFGADFDFI